MVGDLTSQQLVASRRVDWTRAGVSRDLIVPELKVDIHDHGGVADGSTSNNAALQSALNALDGSPGLIVFSKGTYFFTQTIHLPDGVVLQGSGAGNTELLFNLNGAGHCIAASGSRSQDSIPVVANIDKGQSYIEVDDTTGLLPGAYFLLLFDDDALIHDSWAKRTIGQINRIVDRDDHGIFVENRIRKNYSEAQHPFIETISCVQHVGIECLKIKRLDMTSAQTTNIYFNLAAECWISDVESDQANYAHVTFQRSTKCSVEGSYFHHAFAYGGGGVAYGVVLQNTTGDMKVVNSIFEHLRHGILLQAGVNGNVIAYNYSTDPYKTINILGMNFPSNNTGDLVCHGNYPFANLFEGNVAAYGIVDASHGANGPYNTYFRNRMTLYGLQVSNSTPDNDSQNLIGNEVSDWSLAESDHYLFGNNLEGTNIPAGTTDLSVLSYYLESRPAYFGNEPWPSIGYPWSDGEGMIPAQVRFNQGTFAVCDVANPCPDTLKIQQIGYDHANYRSQVFLSVGASIHPFHDIHLQAGSAIELSPGTEVWKGGRLEIDPGGCP